MHPKDDLIVICGVADLAEPCTSDSSCLDHCSSGPAEGYCSRWCESHDDCAPNGVCLTGGICWKSCQTTDDCDAGPGGGRHLCYPDNTCRPWAQVKGKVAFVSAGASVTLSMDGHDIVMNSAGSFTFPATLRNDETFHVVGDGQQGDHVITVTSSAADVHCSLKRTSGNVDQSDLWVSCGRQQWFTTPGAHAWVVPAGVTSISVAAVGPGGSGSWPACGGGGGELCYSDVFTVTPGSTVEVFVGAGGSVQASTVTFASTPRLSAKGGNNAATIFGFPGGPNNGNDTCTFGAGGTGGTLGTCNPGGQGGDNGGGGGAGGYASASGKSGGWGGNQGGLGVGGGPGVGGAGGGGSSSGGGCVGLEGQGNNGLAGTGPVNRSGSAASEDVPCGGSGGTLGSSGDGAVRIMWGGVNRRFPDNASNQ